MMSGPAFMASLRDRLGVAADTSPEAILAALDGQLEAAAYGLPPSVAMIDKAVLADLQARAARAPQLRAVLASDDDGDDIYAKAWGSPATVTGPDDPNYPKEWR